MKIHRTVIGTLLVLMPLAVLTAAPSITTFVSPPPGQYNIEQLWNLTLNNPDNQTYQVWLEGTITKTGQGQVFWAKTKVFPLPPGTKGLRYSDIEAIGIERQTHAPGYEQFAARTGGLPEGDYTFTVKLEPNFGSKQNPFPVKPMGPPRLIGPSDGDTVRQDGLVLVWAAPSARKLGGMTYTIRVAEVLPGMTKEQALLSGQPWFERSSIGPTMLSYPPDARKLVPGHAYAWEVMAVPEGGVGEHSGPAMFVVGSGPSPTPSPKGGYSIDFLYFPNGVEWTDYGTDYGITLKVSTGSQTTALYGEYSRDGGPWSPLISKSVPPNLVDAHIGGGSYPITSNQVRFKYVLKLNGNPVAWCGPVAVYRNPQGKRQRMGQFGPLSGGLFGKTHTLICGQDLNPIPWSGTRIAYVVTKSGGWWTGGTPCWYTSNLNDGRVLVKIKVPGFTTKTVNYTIEYWLGPDYVPPQPTEVTRSGTIDFQCSFFGKDVEVQYGVSSFPNNGYRISCGEYVSGDGSLNWADWVEPTNSKSGMRKASVHLKGEGVGHKEATLHWWIKSME